MAQQQSRPAAPAPAKPAGPAKPIPGATKLNPTAKPGTAAPPAAGAVTTTKPAVNTAVAQRLDALEAMITADEFMENLRRVKARWITEERMVSMVMYAAMQEPKIAICTPESIVKAVLDSAMLGLDCAGRNGEGWLIPFRDNKKGVLELQFMVGYQGMITTAIRAGAVKRIEAQVVYMKDDFVLKLGLNPVCDLIPFMSGNRGDIKASFAIADMGDGQKQIEYILKEDYEKIKASSRSSDSLMYTKWPDQAWRKAAIRRLYKYLRKTPELDKLIEYIDETEGLKALASEAEGDRHGDAPASVGERIMKKIAAGAQEPPAPATGEEKKTPPTYDTQVKNGVAERAPAPAPAGEGDAVASEAVDAVLADLPKDIVQGIKCAGLDDNATMKLVKDFPDHEALRKEINRLLDNDAAGQA